MRVLFFCSDGVSAPVRLRPLLETLRAAGDIAHFACVDRDMALSGGGESFDVVLVHRNPGRRQIAWLQRSGVPFVYDIDDFLLRDSDGLDRRRALEQEAIRWCLANATYVTAPSRRLLATLAARLPEPLGARAVFLPNAGFAPRTEPAPAGRPRLLWVSSAGQHYDELRAIGAGIAAAAAALETDVVLVGRFPEVVRAALPGHTPVAWIEPQEFRRFLVEGSFVAVAPLPLALGAAEQAFVDCKSDIKAAQYGSLGIAALYSPAPPYRETDLPCTLAPTNTAADWRDGLIALARAAPAVGMRLAAHPALAARSPQAVAAKLLDVLARVRAAAGAPFRFRSIPTPALLRRLEQRVRTVRARIKR